MAQFLPYFVARHAAAEMDRQGMRPGVVVNLLTGITALAALGMLACAGIAVGWAALFAMGVVN